MHWWQRGKVIQSEIKLPLSLPSPQHLHDQNAVKKKYHLLGGNSEETSVV